MLFSRRHGLYDITLGYSYEFVLKYCIITNYINIRQQIN